MIKMTISKYFVKILNLSSTFALLKRHTKGIAGQLLFMRVFRRTGTILMEFKTPNSKQIVKLTDNLITKARKSLEIAKKVKKPKKGKGAFQSKCDS